MFFRKKSKARLKADRKIRGLKEKHKELRRKIRLFILGVALYTATWLLFPAYLCFSLIYFWGCEPLEPLLLAAFLCIAFPYLFRRHISDLAALGDEIRMEIEPRLNKLDGTEKKKKEN